MKDKMTPMKRFSANIQTLKSHIDNIFEVITLNGCNSKYVPHAPHEKYTKGVENDFVLIFKDKSADISFAFTFNYLALPPDKATVSVSIKSSQNNKSIESSSNLSMDEFKEKLNNINKWLHKNKLDNTFYVSHDVFNKVSEIFLDKKLDILKQLQESQEKINTFIKEKTAQLKVNDLFQAAQAAEKKYEKIKDAIYKEVIDSEEYKIVKNLQKEIKRLELSLKTNQNNREKELGLNELKNQAVQASVDHINATKKLKQEIDEEVNQIPKVISKKLKK